MFIEVFLVGILAGMSPGPDFFVVMRNTLGYSRKAGVATALGIGLALTIHVSYTICGFSLIFQKNPLIYQSIQLIGAFYLIWLGIHSIQSSPAKNNFNADNSTRHPKSKDFFQGFRDGFLCNLLNPKAVFFFLSIFSQFLSPGTPNWVKWFYGLEITCAVGIWFVLLAFIISSQRFRGFYQKYYYWFDRILGGVLLYFAARIIVSFLVDFSTGR